MLVFAASRLVAGVLMWWVGRAQIDTGLQPTPTSPPVAVNPPTYLHLVANWDGQWYRRIVEEGYPSTLPRVDGHVVENVWAFYPGYPALVRALTSAGLSFGAAASVVSLVAGVLAVTLLYRMLQRTGGDRVALVGVLTLCFFPAAPVLQAAYTESLALLLLLACLWALGERRYGALWVLALVLALVRPIVLPLAVVVAWHGLVRWRREPAAFPLRERVTVAAVSGSCAAFFLVWPAVAGIVTGEPKAYFLTQQAWIVSDSEATWPSWLARGLEQPGFLLVTLGMLALLAYLVLRRPASAWGDEGRAWVLVYGLYLAAATQATSSVLRYALLMPFPTWPLPELATRLSRRSWIGTLAVLVLLGVLMQWLWLRWTWVASLQHEGLP